MEDDLNLCVACGICCDGTLIGFVQLESDEMPALKKVMEIEEENGHGFFMHPCKNLCDDGCSIYTNRPKKCGEFKCELLNSHEAKEIDFDSAMEIVNIVKQKKITIEQKLATLQIELKSTSFYFKMVELKKILKKGQSESTLTTSHLELKSDIQQLDDLLIKRFGVSLD